MPGYDVSVLNDPNARVLVVGLNWLGDGIMSMPALQKLRSLLHPNAEIDLLLKAGQVPLWEMHAAPNRLITLNESLAGMRQTRAEVIGGQYTHALILPNSPRSALVPFWARIPIRRGAVGKQRRLLLTEALEMDALETCHQQHEMAHILLPDYDRARSSLPLPELSVSADHATEVAPELETLGGRKLVALISGAARGASKCWPADRFEQVARDLIGEGWAVAWLGTPEDEELCARVHSNIDSDVSLNLCGKTSLGGFAAALAAADVVVANDSGGMHLAGALGTCVVGIFGITDPSKTGALGEHVTILQQSDIRSRKVPRQSEEAVAALSRIQPDEVVQAVLAMPV